jgi:hypothetical protein
VLRALAGKVRSTTRLGAGVKNAGLWQWNSDDIDDDNCVDGDVSLRSHSR